MSNDTTYTIHVGHDDNPYTSESYVAIFDGYDGAPDSSDPYGRGSCHREAILDLLESHYCVLEDGS